MRKLTDLATTAATVDNANSRNGSAILAGISRSRLVRQRSGATATALRIVRNIDAFKFSEARHALAHFEATCAAEIASTLDGGASSNILSSGSWKIDWMSAWIWK